MESRKISRRISRSAHGSDRGESRGRRQRDRRKTEAKKRADQSDRSGQGFATKPCRNEKREEEIDETAGEASASREEGRVIVVGQARRLPYNFPTREFLDRQDRHRSA